MHAPEQRCARVRQINYHCVCKQLIFSIYGSSPGQLLLWKGTCKAPVLCPFGLAPSFQWMLFWWGYMGFSHFRCWSVARHLSWWLAGASSLPLPLQREVLQLWSVESRPLQLFVKDLCVPFTHIRASHSFPFSPTGWPAQPADPCQPTATPKCQPSLRAAASTSLLFHVGRKVQFHFCSAAALIPSLFSPPCSFSASRICAFWSTALHPSVAWSQALM